MDERPQQVVQGYPSGPDSTQAATAHALVKADHARAVILVEGISDQIALETLAARYERDLTEEGIVVVPVGGAQAISKFLARFSAPGRVVRVGGLCDAGEVEDFCRGLASAGLGEANNHADLERLGFFVCVKDLEDELIRAVGQKSIEAVLSAEDELGAFRTLQKQAAWRDQSFDAQMRRFLGSRAGRKHRYAQQLVRAVDLSRVPTPLSAVLAHA